MNERWAERQRQTSNVGMRQKTIYRHKTAGVNRRRHIPGEVMSKQNWKRSKHKAGVEKRAQVEGETLTKQD